MDAKVDISQVVLETERLILRAWKQSDLQDFYDYASVDGVGQMAGWLPHENIEKSQMILDKFIEMKLTFALVDKQTGKVIGSLGLESCERNHLKEPYDSLLGREIGYVLSKDYWGKGLMPEAVKRVIQYAFEEAKMDFLTCGHFNENNQSRRVIEKCGFQYLKDTEFTTRTNEVKQGKLYILMSK